MGAAGSSTSASTPPDYNGTEVIVFIVVGVIAAIALGFLIRKWCIHRRMKAQQEQRKQLLPNDGNLRHRRRLTTPFADLARLVPSQASCIKTAPAIAHVVNPVEQFLSMNGIEYVIGASC